MKKAIIFAVFLLSCISLNARIIDCDSIYIYSGTNAFLTLQNHYESNVHIVNTDWIPEDPSKSPLYFEAYLPMYYSAIILKPHSSFKASITLGNDKAVYDQVKKGTMILWYVVEGEKIFRSDTLKITRKWLETTNNSIFDYKYSIIENAINCYTPSKTVNPAIYIKKDKNTTDKIIKLDSVFIKNLQGEKQPLHRKLYGNGAKFEKTPSDTNITEIADSIRYRFGIPINIIEGTQYFIYEFYSHDTVSGTRYDRIDTGFVTGYKEILYRNKQTIDFNTYFLDTNQALQTSVFEYNFVKFDYCDSDSLILQDLKLYIDGTDRSELVNSHITFPYSFPEHNITSKSSLDTLCSIQVPAENLLYREFVFEVTGTDKNGQLCRYYYIGALNFKDPSSVNETGETKNIILTPNPATDKAQVKLSNDEIQSISLYDMLGNKVAGYPVARGTNFSVLPISTIPEGVYILQIQGLKGIYTEKLIKN